jgi:Family of unknown function (DUF6131)
MCLVSGTKAATKLTASSASDASMTITHAGPNAVLGVGNHWTMTKLASQLTLARRLRPLGMGTPMRCADCGAGTKGMGRGFMIILGVILLILGALLDVSVLWVLGVVLAVIGVVLWLFGSMNRAIGPRRHYW